MTTYRVDIIERERGWGQRCEGKRYFTGKNALVDAKKYVDEHNAKWMPPLKPGESVPDCYLLAETPHLVPDEEAPIVTKPKKKKKARA